MEKVAHDIDLHTVIQGCVVNDRASQKELYNHFYYRMMNLVKRYIDDPLVAEEVLNNGYLVAFKKIYQYRFEGSFEGWLRRIVFHEVANYVKANKSKTKLVLADKHIEPNNTEINNGYTDLCHKQLMQLVDTLPTSTGEVFNLYVYKGLNHNEISRTIGISVGTSKWHLSEGRRILREKIIKMDLLD